MWVNELVQIDKTICVVFECAHEYSSHTLSLLATGYERPLISPRGHIKIQDVKQTICG